jgi:hypothetical protein
MASITFQSRAFGRDPMDAYAEKQGREQRKAKERQEQQEPRRQDVRNSPLPEYPRRWEDEWSVARRRAEALFSGGEDERNAPSAARQAIEALFK